MAEVSEVQGAVALTNGEDLTITPTGWVRDSVAAEGAVEGAGDNQVVVNGTVQNLDATGIGVTLSDGGSVRVGAHGRIEGGDEGMRLTSAVSIISNGHIEGLTSSAIVYETQVAQSVSLGASSMVRGVTG